MTKLEIATAGMEMEQHYYEHDHSYWHMLYPFLWKAKVFTCPHCHEAKTFSDLEVWDDDKADYIAADKMMCSCCYESSMGEDL